MSEASDVDFGPLTALVGEWRGGEGVDIAPEPDGEETNPYAETITYSAVGGVTNAESQNLAAIHYRQIVRRKSDGAVFHDETGYWMWDAKTGVVMQSLAIPRGVCLLAGGKAQPDQTKLEVNAALNSEEWGILQSPFMKDKAKTVSFSHEISVDEDKLSYTETTVLEIYGKTFDHKDSNELRRYRSS